MPTPPKNAADYNKAKKLYPTTTSLTTKDWVEHFGQRPDVMYALLGDIYTMTKANEAVIKKRGRRSRHIDGNLDDLYAMITPDYSREEFGPAVQQLMGDQSLRGFAAKIPMHYWSLARMMRGERPVVSMTDPHASMTMLEQIARAGGVQPSYFAEYRTLAILSLLTDLFGARPNLSIGVYNQLKKALRDGNT